MNTLYKILFCFIAVSFFACDNDDTEVPERNQLTLTPSADRVVLDQTKPNEEVLTFTWTKATDIGPEYNFMYIFRLDIAGKDFETAIDPIIAEDGVFSVSFTNEELYTWIVEKWGGIAGQETTIEGRIVAKVLGPKFLYPEIVIKSVVVQTYLPQSIPLYLMGTATDAGANPSLAIKMTEVSNGRVYSWKGKLKQGNYKFIYNPASLLPSLNKGDSETSVVLRETADDPDTQFSIITAGTYSIYLSIKDMTISTNEVPYENLYLVGDATTIGWDPKGVLMNPDAANPNIYTVETTLKAGELKILTAPNWEAVTFHPTVADGSITSTETKLYAGDPDYKWKVTADQAGTYKITLNVKDKVIHFIKL